MDVEESIRGNPLDGVVLMCGCDKTTPSLVMGAASCDLPTIVLSGGAALNGKYRGADIGVSHLWKFSEDVKAGLMTEQEFVDAEPCLMRSSGNCMVPAPAAARVGGPAPAMFAAAVVGAAILATPSADAATLERIRDTGHIRFGFMTNAPPFSLQASAGGPDGYAVSLCKSVADHLKRDLALPGLTIDWVPLAADERLTAVHKGKVDLLCAPMSETLGRRAHASFSIPIFAGGNRAALRADAPAPLRNVLSEARPTKPVWRGTPAATVLESTKLAVVGGTTGESWLNERAKTLQVNAHIMRVRDYRTALQQLVVGDVDVVFGDRVVMLGALQELEPQARANVTILDRLFTHEPAGLALEHGDDDFRVLVDRALSRTYASPEFPALYSKWCGEFDERARAFFVWNTLPE
jgi:polar amino acid transport system substrate-binding protein